MYHILLHQELLNYSQTTVNRKVWALRDAEYVTSKLKVNKADMFYITSKGRVIPIPGVTAPESVKIDSITN